ncbi:hypothetical protein W97_05358 [Coniosporium apollinis CBS 100218]|uniref:Coupling of ubiquitin conjugation to ER degradation protein 1 n=1 Tax=Coniosporium apollinis (strain CBS 100218) TaxID=1168221 RepID=R7YW28_CONA1|nr:uncharacterized protein W97_05358 [Coniosporium apollinis CBS 100218]EON66115.1 hypothetical protein W97_05358 [Coniosporium apollinis CBS 100218]
MSDQGSINIPQIFVILLVGFLLYRWFFTSSDPAGIRQSRQNGARLNPAQVEQLLQMFPQLDRRQLMWDLQRNGGSVAATTERVLGGRGLEVPPPSFQPQLPPLSSTSTGARPGAAAVKPKPSHPDLITRYNLSSKVGSSASIEPSPKPAWSQNKNERQQLLQRRREEMILAARRKMEERDRAGAGGTA